MIKFTKQMPPENKDIVVLWEDMDGATFYSAVYFPDELLLFDIFNMVWRKFDFADRKHELSWILHDDLIKLVT